MNSQSKLLAKFSMAEAWKAFVSVSRACFLFILKPQPAIREKDLLPFSPLAVGVSLLALSLVVTAMLALAALPLFLMADAAPGSQLHQVMSRSIASVVLAVGVIGPLIEEGMFRGWLSGTWRSVVGSTVFVALVFGVIHVVDGLFSVSAAIIQLGLAAIGMIGFQLLSPIDTGRRLPYFERAFPFIFWAQGIVFGVLHFQNIATISPVVAVLYTLPLVICAWLWGFARIYLGLASAVLLHAVYNVPAVAGMLTIVMLQGT